jgi:hypothetical protein
MPSPVHPHVEARLRLRARQCRPRHPGPAGVARPQEHPAHGALHRAGSGPVQELLALINRPSRLEAPRKARHRVAVRESQIEPTPGPKRANGEGLGESPFTSFRVRTCAKDPAAERRVPGGVRGPVAYAPLSHAATGRPSRSPADLRRVLNATGIHEARNEPVRDGIALGVFAMACASYLGDFDVDAETIRVLHVALEMTRAAVGLADDFANGIIARQIIELARAGERNPDLLCEVAMKRLGGALFGD